MYAHMLASLLDACALAADKNTYFLLCYLRTAVIVHMQCRLSKHGEQKNKWRRWRRGEVSSIGADRIARL